MRWVRRLSASSLPVVYGTEIRFIAELKKMLTEEIVHFVFEKTDGTRRDAYGTRDIDVIRKYDSGSTNQKPQRAFNGTFPYFDIEKGEWRCFKVDKFVMIDEDYTL